MNSPDTCFSGSMHASAPSAMALPFLQRRRQALGATKHAPLRTWSRSRRNVQGLELRQSLLGHDGCVNALCWSWDGQLLFSGSDDSTVCVWRAAGDGSLLSRFSTGFSERVFDLKLLPAPNDHLLVACSMDASIKVFDVNRILAAAYSAKIFANTARPSEDSVVGGEACCVRTFAVHSAPVKRAAVIPDAPSEFISCAEDGTARHFDIREPLPPTRPSSSELWLRGGRIVADYHKLRAELHALDVNIFHPFVFAVGGTLTSIMVHDRRMLCSGLARNRRRQYVSSWADDGCVVRLRRDKLSSKNDVYERISDSTVTGLRFSRDEPNLVIGSWCYDHVYLFDLNRSPTFASAVRDDLCKPVYAREREPPSDLPCTPPLVKRARSSESDHRPLSGSGCLLAHSAPCGEDWWDRPAHLTGQGSIEASNLSSFATGIATTSDTADVVNYAISNSMHTNADDLVTPTAESANVCSPCTSRGIRGFGRGQFYGVRLLSRDEAPYMFDSDSEHGGDASGGYSESGSVLAQQSYASATVSTHRHDIRCDICLRERCTLSEAVLPLGDTAGHLPDPCAYLSHAERNLVFVSFDTFAADMDSHSLVPALGSISFAIRQMDGEGARPTAESLAALRSLESIEHIDELKESLLAMRLDAGLDCDRARSILYNNRACLNATMFRQKWIKRFDAYLRGVDLCSYDLETIRNVASAFQGIRGELESATRDCSISLQLNRYNVLAHYNRLLISWDSMRFDVMLYVLDVLPLMGVSASYQSTPIPDNDVAVLYRLRAEFGELPFRVREAFVSIRSGWDSVRKEAKSIQCFSRVVDQAGKRGNGSLTLGQLVHSNERFFEVSSRLAAMLCDDADAIVGLLDRHNSLFGDMCFSSDVGANGYALAMQGLSKCWIALGMFDNLANLPPDSLGVLQTVFRHSLFAAEGQPPPALHVYLWHRHFPSIDRQRQENSRVIGRPGVDDLATLPTDGVYRPDPDDEVPNVVGFAGSAHEQPNMATMIQVGQASAMTLPAITTGTADSTLLDSSHYSLLLGSGADPGQRAEQSPGAPNMSVGVAELSNSSPLGSSADAESQSALLLEGAWPRPTCEYLPLSKTAHSPSSQRTSWGRHDQVNGDNEQPNKEGASRRPIPIVLPCQRYKGHCNFQTIKDVNYLFGGYVASGSDDGSLFIWDRSTMEVVQIVCGDSEVVNVIEGHPSLPMIAVSGIDSEVQIFSLSPGGPSKAHRSNFPLVREQHFSEAGIADCGFQRAYADAVYARDPYEQALARSGHSALPFHVDLSEVTRHIPRPFPAVSTSRLWEHGRIASQNEDMRLSGLANASLTRQIMHSVIFSNMFGADGSSSSSSSDGGDSDVDSSNEEAHTLDQPTSPSSRQQENESEDVPRVRRWLRESIAEPLYGGSPSESDHDVSDSEFA